MAFTLNLLQAGAADWLIVAEYHGGDDEGRNPYLAFDLTGGTLRLTEKHWNGSSLSAGSVLWSYASFPENQDFDFVLEHKAHATAGYIRLYVNGVQEVNYSGGVGYTDQTLGGYPIVGLYRASHAVVSRALFSNLVTS